MNGALNAGRRRLSLTSLVILAALFALSTGHAQESTGVQSRQLERLPSVNTWPGKPKRWALVIGVDHYVDPQISPLRGAANDAHALADALVRYAGFPEDQVILLATDQPIERQPTRLNILKRLSNLGSLVPKDGLLLVSFAGHGTERGGQAYLVPSDAQLSDDIAFLEESAVSVSRMKERIKATGVGQVVVLLDACRNDPGGRADAPNLLTTAYTNAFNFDVRNREVSAFATLYATGIGQRAFEYTEKKQGYFTWTLVEGLRGAAANSNGEVTLAALVKYVQETVPKRVAIDLGAGKQQRPFSVVEGYRAEELVIAVSKPGGASGSISTPPAGSAVDPLAIELEYWDTIKSSTNSADFQSYLDKYPDGQFAVIARNKIKSLGSPERTSPRSDATESNATELAFWDAVKGSSNPEDFRAYVRKYPNGAFVEIANNRIEALKSAAENKPAPAAASSRPEETFKPVTFDVRNGISKFAPRGTLYISSSGVEFKVDQHPEKNRSMPCAEIREATAVKNMFGGDTFQVTVKMKDQAHNFMTRTTSDATAIARAVIIACAGSMGGPETTTSPSSKSKKPR